jgi:hypothetical protein
MRNRLGALLIVPSMTAFVLAAPSGTVSAEDGAHDGGFFMRLSSGFGSTSPEASEAGQTLELSGDTGDFNFAFGGIVARNLAVHATLWGWAIEDPDEKITGMSTATAKGDLVLGAIGAGVTYYVMPVNVYLSGSAGIGELWFDTSGIDTESDTGPVVDLTVGKEWWVGRKWALGVAGGFGWYSLQGGAFSNQDLDGTSWALRFTATMN